MTGESDELKRLATEGQEHDLYGVDNLHFKLDNTVYEAVENESEDYRSYLETVKVAENQQIFFDKPVARVKVIKADESTWEGYRLVDGTGHVWLEVGTSVADDYYPCFDFTWHPKEG